MPDKAEDASPVDTSDHLSDIDDDSHMDEDSMTTGADGEPKKKFDPKDPSRPRRKKARRACYACQRAHLTCGK